MDKKVLLPLIVFLLLSLSLRRTDAGAGVSYVPQGQSCVAGSRVGADQCYYNHFQSTNTLCCCWVWGVVSGDICEVGTTATEYRGCSSGISYNKCHSDFKTIFSDGTLCTNVGNWGYTSFFIYDPPGTSGRWDSDEGACIVCDGKKQGKTYGDSSGLYLTSAGKQGTGFGKCEGACGSASCDEVTPGSCAGDGHGYCSSDCSYTRCNEGCGAECSTNAKCVSLHGSGWTCNSDCECASPTCTPSWGNWIDQGCGISCGTAGTCSSNYQCERRSDGCGNYQYQCSYDSSCSSGGSYNVNFYQSGLPNGINWCVNAGGTICKAAYPSSSYIPVTNIASGTSYSYSLNYYGPDDWVCTSGCSGTITSSGNKYASFCKRKDCEDLGKTCGSWSNGCDGTVDCGTCTGANEICADGDCTTAPPCGYSGGINPASYLSCSNPSPTLIPYYSGGCNSEEECEYACEQECNSQGYEAWEGSDYGGYGYSCQCKTDGLECGNTYCNDDCCNGNTFYTYPDNCKRECVNQVCESSCDTCSPSATICSQSGDKDGDGIGCNCDCGGYDVIETGNDLCDDGIDNDCDDLSDCDDSGCSSLPLCAVDLCGNGNIDSGEDCELKSTNNNAYCIQTQKNCDTSSRKYCTRDGLGNCNNLCKCVYDTWSCGPVDDSSYCNNCNHIGDGYCNCGENSLTAPDDNCAACSIESYKEVTIRANIRGEKKPITLSYRVDPTPTTGSITVVFDPSVINPLISTTSVMKVTINNVPAESYTIIITGSDGEVSETTTYTLNVPAH